MLLNGNTATTGLSLLLCRKRLGAAGLGGGAIGNLVCKLLCLCRWLNAEFVAQQCFQVVELLEGQPSLTEAELAVHQQALRGFAQRVERHQLLGNRQSLIAAFKQGEFFQNADCLLAELRPLDGEPAFKAFVAAAEVRQQFAAVKPGRFAQRFDLVGLSGFQEGGDIDAHGICAQADRIVLDLKDGFIGVAQFLAQRGQRLPQAAARLFVGPVAPEQARQAFAGCRHAR